MIVVGCGLLGSLFVEELVRRVRAAPVLKKKVEPILLYDYDVVEERNLVAQGFSYEDLGKPKAHSLAGRWEDEIEILPHTEKVESLEGLPAGGILVDAVDNLPTRKLLDAYDGTVLHLGVSRANVGEVSWTWSQGKKRLSTWSLRKVKTSSEEEDVKDPPCELIETRGVAALTVWFGAKALGIVLGFNPHDEPGGYPSYNITLSGVRRIA